MRYDELMNAVAETRPDHWVVLNPPSVEKIKTSGVEDLEVWLDGHGAVAYLRGDLDVSVAWGAEQKDGPWEGAWAEWSTYPDETVYGIYAEVRWRGRPVHRQTLAMVDGARHYLPAPNAIIAEDNRTIERWVVEAPDLPLARLIDGLAHQGSDLDELLRQTGLTVRG